ncbi:MAG: accessory factor UbiK family protein, partial [Kiloniellales bacterium]|nr:accessory factor UbiK family protein [Kiloniellales bacterium]
MQTQNKLLDDLARVASGALGVASGMREEVEARLRDQFERVLARMELVTREEFEAVRAMAVKAREEQELLNERVAALEAALESTREATRDSAPQAKAAKAKPAAAKASAKTETKTEAKTEARPETAGEDTARDMGEDGAGEAGG